MFRCLGPEASAVTYGRLTSVCCALDSSILARSAASFRRCRASGSLRRSMPWSLLNRSEEHTSELQSLMRISYAVFCLKKKKKKQYLECYNTQTHGPTDPT